MNEARVSENAADAQRARAAMIVGASFLFFTIASVFHYSLVEAHLLVSENLEDVARFIHDNERLFRLGIILDLVLFASGVVLSVSLYVLLRDENEGLALIALSCMVIETTVSVMIELSSFVALWVLGDHSEPSVGALLGLGLVLRARAAGYVLAILFFSLGMGLFSYLFLRDKRATSPIAMIGLLSFSVMIAATIVNIGAPAHSVAASSSEAVGRGASVIAMLSQIAMGAWLLFKGKPRDETIRLRE